jgi:hypothetical protein
MEERARSRTKNIGHGITRKHTEWKKRNRLNDTGKYVGLFVTDMPSLCSTIDSVCFRVFPWPVIEIDT